MLLFKKTAKRKLSPANIQLNLGKSPPQYQNEYKKSKSISPQKQLEHKGELKRSYSISPQKRREPSNKSYTSHDLREGINEYYTQLSLPYNKPKPPKINLMTKIGMLTNNLKKTLFTKEKPVFLNLGVSPPHKNEQTPVQHNSLTNKYKNSIGGKIIAKSSRKPNKQKK